MPSRDEIEAILGVGGGVFVAGRHPRLRRTAERMASVGLLRCLLPGVYCRWQESATSEVRIRAMANWLPDAVLTGRAAARLTYWPTISVPVVTASCRPGRVPKSGFAITHETIPPELITEVGGCRATVPALTALDLALDLGGEGIDRALRMRRARLDDMAGALRMTAGRAGNVERRRWLLESRDEPWSEAEREGHRLLRIAGITGWKGNVAAVCGDDLYYLDIGFRALKLGIEIDGREVHAAENVRQFHHDRRKWTALTLQGWMLLHFAANHVFDESAWFVDCVGSGVALRRRQLA